MYCTICGNKHNGMICARCKFDDSLNYEKYPTLDHVGANLPSTGSVRNAFVASVLDQISIKKPDAQSTSPSDQQTPWFQHIRKIQTVTEDCPFSNNRNKQLLSVESTIKNHSSPSEAQNKGIIRYDILKQYNCKGCGNQIDGIDLVFGSQERCPVCGECNWAELSDEIRSAVNSALERQSPRTGAHSQALKNAKYLLDHFQTDEALNSYRELAKNGCSAAFLPTAQIYYNDGMYKQAWKWYQEAAKAGEGEGLYRVGVFYLRGIYVSRNERAAVKNLKMAAQNGNLAAIELLSQCYMSGKGCEKDEPLARKYLSILAEYDNANAQYFMGEFLREAGGEKNIIKAAEYYRRAASNGHPEAKALQDECLQQLPPHAQAQVKDLLGV